MWGDGRGCLLDVTAPSAPSPPSPSQGLGWNHELIGHGRCLQAGDTVITGTCVVPVPVTEDDVVTVDFGALGTLSVTLTR